MQKLMPKRKRLWKHQVPVVELLSIININYVHSNKDFRVFGWMLLSSFELEKLFFPKSPVYLFLCTVGFAWLPLLKDAQLASQEHHVPVASSLPPNYLSLQEPSGTKVFIHTSTLLTWHRASVCRCFSWDQTFAFAGECKGWIGFLV